MNHVRHYLQNFLPHPSRGLREIFLSTALLDLAVGAIMIFEPIYLRSIGFSLTQIMLFYLALYVVYFFLLPLGGRICRRHGYEHTILYSSPFLILYYLSLFAIPYHPVFIVVAILALAVQKTLYWPGYHANFAKATIENEVGRELSGRVVIGAVISAVAPALGGLVAATLGFRALLIFVACLIVVSNIPLLATPEVFAPSDFSYRDALRRLTLKENRRRLFAFFGFGEEMILLTLWPIFIALVVSDVFSIGIIVALAGIAGLAAALYVGRLSDNGGRRGALRGGTLYMAATWLVRAYAVGAASVFFSDAFHRVARTFVGIPLVAYLYDDARRGDAIASVVFFEMALSLGKILAAVLCIVFIALFPNPWLAIFALAAAFSLLYALVAKPASHKADSAIIK